MFEFDECLQQVWEWKQRVYQEIKDLDDKEKVKRIEEVSEELLDKAGIKLERLSTK